MRSILKAASFAAVAWAAAAVLGGSPAIAGGHDHGSREVAGTYLSGDFHQHTYYTDGSTTFPYVMEKNNAYGLDWWANSEHGGSRNRDGLGHLWTDTLYYPTNPILGDVSGTPQAMWRWQSLQEYVYPDIQVARLLYPTKKIFSGLEWNVPGHEHCSTGIVADDATAISAFEFIFDASDNDTSRNGEVTEYGTLEKRNGKTYTGPGVWTDKSFPDRHLDAVAGCAWMQEQKDAGAIEDGWIVFAHVERDGAWTAEDGGGYNVEHFRDFNNAGPDVCFGFEGAPGHQTSKDRGGFGMSAFGGTWGGAGYYTAAVGGLWDALLGEGRRYFNFASSDFHSYATGFEKGGGDFHPGEYQRDRVYVEDADRDGDYSHAEIVAGMRSGNSFHVMGDLVTELEFTAQSGRGKQVPMGGNLRVARGEGINLTIRFKSPATNTCPDFAGSHDCAPPVVDHIDLIAGEITGKKQPGTPEYTMASNPTTRVLKSFTAADWTVDAEGYNVINYRIRKPEKDLYFRLRGTNLAPNTPCETDPAGNPLPDFIASACNGSTFDGPREAYADLWFYTNPIFADVNGR
jgi:hypothetical protein